jgi:hypothetical protein
MGEKTKKLYRFAYVKGTTLTALAVASGMGAFVTVSGKSLA